MKKPYSVTLPVFSSVTFWVRAEDEEAAKELAIERFDGMSISLCHQCANDLDEPTVSCGDLPVSAYEQSEYAYQSRMRLGKDDADFEDEDSEVA